MIVVAQAPVVMNDEGCVRDVCVQLHTIHDLDSQNILQPTHRAMFIYNIYYCVTKTFVRSAFAIAIGLFWYQTWNFNIYTYSSGR